VPSTWSAGRPLPSSNANPTGSAAEITAGREIPDIGATGLMITASGIARRAARTLHGRRVAWTDDVLAGVRRRADGRHEPSRALAGFANFGSIAIQTWRPSGVPRSRGSG
jgi:hypothetical protein